MIRGSKKKNCIVCPSVCFGQGVIYIVPKPYTDKYCIKFMCDECNATFEGVEELASNVDSNFSLNMLDEREKKSFILNEVLSYEFLISAGYEVENVDEY